MQPRSFRVFDLSTVLLLLILALGVWLYGGAPEAAKERRSSVVRGIDNFLGGMSVGQLVAQYGGIDEDPEVNERVTQIFERLVPVAKAERPDLEYSIAVLNSEIPNAFALPGGRTFITRGLVQLLDDDDEIAGVLGHELVHTVKSHGTIAFGRDIGLILATDYMLDHVEQDRRAEAAEIARLGQALISTGYSRAAESEADKYGLHYAIAAGYHPLGLVRALEKIEAWQRQQREPGAREIPVYFRTHPLTDDRVRALRAEARALGYDVYVPGDDVDEALRRLYQQEQDGGQ